MPHALEQFFERRAEGFSGIGSFGRDEFHFVPLTPVSRFPIIPIRGIAKESGPSGQGQIQVAKATQVTLAGGQDDPTHRRTRFVDHQMHLEAIDIALFAGAVAP